MALSRYRYKAVESLISRLQPELMTEPINATTITRDKIGDRMVVTATRGDNVYHYNIHANTMPVIQPDTSDGAALSIVRHWLQKCLSTHHECADESQKFIPKRLLHVGDDERDPRLCEKLATKKRYCVLSYCWGLSKEAYKTTRENLSHHKEAVPMSLLPKTLQDAIVVCRFLRVPCLWVDALCIVQNDVGERDWHEHLELISDIYSNAVLTIAAEGSSDCTAGFLGKQKYGNWPYCLSFVDAGLLSPGRSTIISRGFPLREEHKNLALPSTSSVLSRRGWALQERISSRRIIQFTGNEMVWHCRTEKKCECGFQDFSHVHSLNATFSSDKERSEYDKDSAFRSWQSVVEDYSGRDLTYTSDRLVALSGLAHRMQWLYKAGDYLAGLWKENLERDLLWYVASGTVTYHPRAYLAPSWSWASLMGRVEYFKLQHLYEWILEIYILEATCITTRVSLTGAVSSGELRLMGTPIPVLLELEEQIGPSRTSQYTINVTRAKPAKYLAYARVNSKIVLESLLDCASDTQIDIADFEFPYRGDGRCGALRCSCSGYDSAEFFLLPMGSSFYQRSGGGRYEADEEQGVQDFCRLWWLVIQRTCIASTFKRVGLGYKTVGGKCSFTALLKTELDVQTELRLI